MKVQLIYNPVAGRRGTKDDLARVRSFLQSKGWEVLLRWTMGPGDAITYAREAVAKGCDMAVAVGGDGTLGEVANGLVGSDCVMGVLPIGTGNVWARMMDIPFWTPVSRSALLDAAQVLVDGQVHQIDLGRAGDRYFVLWTGVGIDAQVAREVEPHREIRRNLGNLTYYVTMIALSLNLRGSRVTIVIDGKAIRQRAFLILVANAQLYGGSLKIAPKARLDDGLLDVCVFKGGSLLDVLRHFAMVVLGRHLSDPKVEVYRAVEVEIHGDRALPLHLDGEPCGHTPVRITIVPKALRVIVPQSASASLFEAGASQGEVSSLTQRIGKRLRTEEERWREQSEYLREALGRRLGLPHNRIGNDD